MNSSAISLYNSNVRQSSSGGEAEPSLWSVARRWKNSRSSRIAMRRSSEARSVAASVSHRPISSGPSASAKASERPASSARSVAATWGAMDKKRQFPSAPMSTLRQPCTSARICVISRSSISRLNLFGVSTAASTSAMAAGTRRQPPVAIAPARATGPAVEPTPPPTSAAAKDDAMWRRCPSADSLSSAAGTNARPGKKAKAASRRLTMTSSAAACAADASPQLRVPFGR
mmetsp:Transcript_107475/g.302456  ORF Transcript_107475/g.302456 Transcript_107475/m.302456 type:complete len:230 (-) Transcript_107475:327-1016(-)